VSGISAIKPIRFLTALICLQLSACISYEPLVLVPAITLSAEDILLVDPRSGNAGDSIRARVDFGIDTSINESDSLINVEVLPGVRVRSVTPNGAADAAGIKLGDIILTINEMETNHPDAITALQTQAVSDSDSDSEYTFKVRRNTVVFAATLIAREVGGNPPPLELFRADPLASRAGYRTEMIRIANQLDSETELLAAARVMEIFPDSPLLAANIEVGDLILTVNEQKLNSAQDLINRLNQDYQYGEQLVLGVYDGRSVRAVNVRLWDPGRRISRISLGPIMRYESSLNPPSNRLSLLDFWLFSLYRYSSVDGESSHSLLGLFNFTSDYGELTEEPN